MISKRNCTNNSKFDILDADDEEDQNLKLLGEDEMDDDDDIPAQTDDQEELNDPEDEQVEERNQSFGYSH